MTLSAVILTKNAEGSIEKCLRSVSFVDEILIIDDYSTDKTLDIVHKVFKVHQVYQVYTVMQRKLAGDFAAQRNFALEKATGDWVLFVDADEEVTDELQQEIKEVTSYKIQDKSAYFLKRSDYFWGKELKYGETMKARDRGIVRLIKKGSGIWEGKAHEEFKIGSSKLEVGSLKNFLNHYPHQTVKEFLQEVNFYSSIRAKELFSQGEKTNIFVILAFPLGKFVWTYMIKLGFLDGPAGFAYAFFMSFHSFLVRAKLYQLTRIDTEEVHGITLN